MNPYCSCKITWLIFNDFLKTQQSHTRTHKAAQYKLQLNNKKIQSLYRELLSLINHLIANDRRSHSRIWLHSSACYLFLFFFVHSQPWASSWSSWSLKICRGFCWQISHLTVERHFPNKCLALGPPRLSFPPTVSRDPRAEVRETSPPTERVGPRESTFQQDYKAYVMICFVNTRQDFGKHTGVTKTRIPKT